MQDDIKNQYALFKFSLIAPIINNNFSENTVKEYLENITAKKYTLPNGKTKEFTPNTLRFWVSDYKKYGFDGLMPKSRSDIGNSRVLTKKQKDYIISRKEENSRLTAKHIYNEMLVSNIIVDTEVSLSTVTRFISKNNLKFRNSSKERKAFELENPNDCWQADTSVGPYLIIDGKKKKTVLIMFLDDCSRLITYGEFFFEENVLNLEAVFKKAVASRGISKKLYFDNGKVYQSHQFSMICDSLGVSISYARPYSPESKGKIERTFRSIKETWLNTLDWNKIASLQELNYLFKQFLNEKYFNKIHSSINDTPLNKFMSYADNIKFITSTKQLDYAFLHREQRRVNKDSTVSLNKILFEVPKKYIGDRIKIRFSPLDLSKAYIFNNNEEMTEVIFPVKKIDNSKIKRSELSFTNMEKEDTNNV